MENDRRKYDDYEWAMTLSPSKLRAAWQRQNDIDDWQTILRYMDMYKAFYASTYRLEREPITEAEKSELLSALRRIKLERTEEEDKLGSAIERILDHRFG